MNLLWAMMMIRVPSDINNLLKKCSFSIHRYCFDGNFHSESEGVASHNFVVYPCSCRPQMGSRTFVCMSPFFLSVIWAFSSLTICFFGFNSTISSLCIAWTWDAGP